MMNSVRRAIYYTLKPILPWGIRQVGERIQARRLRKKYISSWPINENAAGTPPDWPGWPDNKDFAFVITHDVEGQKGLANCRKLAELEMEMGARSSFNFVPEGEYAVTPELRTWLTSNGFEV